MTTRLCVLGDSHMAAFQMAASGADAPKNLDLTFFGADQNALASYRATNGQFESANEDDRARIRALVGVDRLDLAAYDAFLVIGMGLSIFPMMRLFEQVASMEMPSVEGAVSAMEDGRSLASGPFLRANSRERLVSSLGFRVAYRLGQATERPVVVLGQPRPARRIAGRPEFQGLETLHAGGDGRFVSAWYEARLSEVCRSAGVLDVPQPEETIDADLFTRPAFLRAGERPKPGAQDDPFHANAAYAKLALNKVADALSERAPTGA